MRTAVYVNGFNLFHSLLESQPGVKWLDLAAMASGALSPQNQVCLVRSRETAEGVNRRRRSR
jgi:hypothetical protein